MSNKPLHPALRLVTSGVLSLLVLYLFPAAGRDPRWLIGLAGVAAGAFVLLVPVMVRGDPWQKMAAGALLFVPCLGLVVAVYGVVSSL
jgi:peptidoglycan/LPS O-acetylase OafA/YrhL